MQYTIYASGPPTEPGANYRSTCVTIISCGFSQTLVFDQSIKNLNGFLVSAHQPHVSFKSSRKPLREFTVNITGPRKSVTPSCPSLTGILQGSSSPSLVSWWDSTPARYFKPLTPFPCDFVGVRIVLLDWHHEHVFIKLFMPPSQRPLVSNHKNI